jgi:tetratricopeptide (TPR) repeat protein
MSDRPIDTGRNSSPLSAGHDAADLLRRLPELEAPEGLSQRIMSALDHHRQPIWRIWLFRLSRPRTISFVPLKWVPLGALVLVLALGLGYQRLAQAPAPMVSRETAPLPVNAETHYRLGRQLLASERAQESLAHFQQAASAQPERALYHFWLGVNYWSLNDFDQELAHYQAALERDPAFLPAHVYSGHNYLDRGEWRRALRHYQQVLQAVPDHAEALYNTGIAHRQLDDTAAENAAWRAYLAHFDRGAQALQATEFLNTNGDFSFRRVQLGPLAIVRPSIAFAPGEAALDDQDRSTLDAIGRIVRRNRQLELHIIAYVAGDAALAKRRSLSIKRYLIARYGDLAPRRIKPSWFGVAETIEIEDRTRQLDNSINLFATMIAES